MSDSKIQNELKALSELQQLARLLLKRVEGHHTIGFFHVKEQWLIQQHLDIDVEWLITTKDTRLEIYKRVDRINKKLVEFNGFGFLSTKGYYYDFVDVISVLTSLQKLLVLDVLADV